MGYHENIWLHQCQEDINSLYNFERIPGNIPGVYVSLEIEIIRYIKYHVNPETDKIKIKISVDGSKVSRISNFVVLSFSVITDDLTLSSKDQNVCCIVNCKEEYDHLKLAWLLLRKIVGHVSKRQLDNVKSSVITEKDNTTKFEILLTFDPSTEILIFILSVSGFT
jgi:hypothetical protein